MAVAAQACRTAPYTRRRPEQSALYRLVQEHLETYLLLAEEGEWGTPAVPAQVEREFRRYLECGILAHGLLAPSMGLAPVPGGWRGNPLPADFSPVLAATTAAMISWSPFRAKAGEFALPAPPAEWRRLRPT